MIISGNTPGSIFVELDLKRIDVLELSQNQKMYESLVLPEKYDKIRKTLQPVIYGIMEELMCQKTNGIETLEYIYELDCMGKLNNQDLIKFLRSEYDIDQLEEIIFESRVNQESDDPEIMLHIMSDRIICDIIRLNGLDEFERLGEMNKVKTLTKLELIAFLQEGVQEKSKDKRESDHSSGIFNSF